MILLRRYNLCEHHSDRVPAQSFRLEARSVWRLLPYYDVVIFAVTHTHTDLTYIKILTTVYLLNSCLTYLMLLQQPAQLRGGKADRVVPVGLVILLQRPAPWPGRECHDFLPATRKLTVQSSWSRTWGYTSILQSILHGGRSSWRHREPRLISGTFSLEGHLGPAL